MNEHDEGNQLPHKKQNKVDQNWLKNQLMGVMCNVTAERYMQTNPVLQNQ